MTATAYFAFLAASALLIAVPGPNIAYIATTSLAHGRRAGLAAVVGMTLAQGAQMALAAAGLAALLATYALAYEVVRWVGAAYLVWIGVHMVRRAGTRRDAPPAAPGVGAFARRGAAIALANPKTMLFHAAFLPQFISTSTPAAPQFVLLGASFLAIAVILDSCWAPGAGVVGATLSGGRIKARLEQAAGLTLIGGGAWLALRRA